MKKTLKISDDKVIVMHCPSVRTVKNAMKQADEMDLIISLISSTCNLSLEEVDNLPFPDFIILQEGLTSFLGKTAVLAPVVSH